MGDPYRQPGAAGEFKRVVTWTSDKMEVAADSGGVTIATFGEGPEMYGPTTLSWNEFRKLQDVLLEAEEEC